MHCVIYKSSKKADSYLFVEKAGDFSRAPAELLQKMGELELVMELELTAERKLARANAIDVMQQLNLHGYYLQLPPGKEL